VFLCRLMVLITLGTHVAHAQERAELRMPAEKNTELTNQPYHLQVQIKTGFAQYSDLSEEDTAASVRVETTFDYKFVTGLDFHSNINLGMLSQRSQKDIPTSDAFEDGFRLKQGYVEAMPFGDLRLDFGVVNQNRSFADVPFLLDDRGFPGAMQRYAWNKDDFAVQFFGMEAIPTSRSLDMDRVQKEALPVFLSQGVQANWHPSEDWRIEALALHYSFSDLPAIVAQDSGNRGNSLLVDTQRANAAFAYAFDGVVLGLGTSWNFAPHLAVNAGIQSLRNLAAPGAYNTGTLIKAGISFRTADIDIKPALISFFNESDTAPAVYNDGRFGHNNREGNGVQVQLAFPKWKFAATGEYIDANIINDDNSHQTRSQFFELFLETNYVDLL
jgi:hypothetical protein